jgi:hemolysin activation/secretion protein
MDLSVISNRPWSVEIIIMPFSLQRKYFNKFSLLSFMLFFSGAASAIAQVAPDAGSLQRQLRSGIPDIRPQQAPTAPAISPQPRDDGPRLRVKGFMIEGASLIPAAELQALIADQTEQDLSLGDLQKLTARISDAYRQRGYFARSYLPAQEARDGIIRITVIEGHFGKVIQGQPPRRANVQFVTSVAASSLQPGAPYSADALERGLLLANDLPGITVDGTLKAGSATGTSDLLLEITDDPLLSGYISGDNSGTRATGHYRGNAGASLNGLAGIGDQLSLLGLASRGLTYGQVEWSLPLGHDGFRARAALTGLDYDLIGDFKDLHAEGTAVTQQVEISYPLLRSDRHSLWARLDYEHGRYDDDALGQSLHRKRLDKGSVALDGNRADAWGGGGASYYAIALTIGSLDLSRLPADAALDAATARTDGNFTKLAIDLRRDQALGGAFFLRGRLVGQWSGSNLDSSEQLALGGPVGVRAYPVNEGIGDSGAVANFELHYPFTSGAASGLDIFGFADAGVTRRHADKWRGWNAGSNDPNSYPLFGVGIGATYAIADGLGASLVAALPIGANQGAPSGLNQDGGKTDPRIWFSLSKKF